MYNIALTKIIQCVQKLQCLSVRPNKVAATQFSHLNLKKTKKLSQHICGFLWINNWQIEKSITSFPRQLVQSKFWLIDGKKYLHSPINQFFGALCESQLWHKKMQGLVLYHVLKDDWKQSTQLVTIINLSPTKSIKGFNVLC